MFMWNDRCDIGAEGPWREFVEENAGLVREIGIPEAAVASHANWVDFLIHGDSLKDPGRFHSWTLDSRRTGLFVTLLERYFEKGYPYFEVTALGHPQYRDILESRLGVVQPATRLRRRDG